MTPNEHTVPDEAHAPRFASLADARSYADALPDPPRPGLIIEKLAPGGCWLPLVWL